LLCNDGQRFILVLACHNDQTKPGKPFDKN
jgi:hypothetical protein